MPKYAILSDIHANMLLLLLQPPPAKLLPEHAHTLEKYSWEAFDGHGQDSSGPLQRGRLG